VDVVKLPTEWRRVRCRDCMYTQRPSSVNESPMGYDLFSFSRLYVIIARDTNVPGGRHRGFLPVNTRFASMFQRPDTPMTYKPILVVLQSVEYAYGRERGVCGPI